MDITYRSCFHYVKGWTLPEEDRRGGKVTGRAPGSSADVGGQTARHGEQADGRTKCLESGKSFSWGGAKGAQHHSTHFLTSTIEIFCQTTWCLLFFIPSYIWRETKGAFYLFKYFLIFLLIRNWIQSKDSLFFDWFDAQYTYNESFLLLQFWIINVGIVCVVNT